MKSDANDEQLLEAAIGLLGSATFKHSKRAHRAMSSMCWGCVQENLRDEIVSIYGERPPVAQPPPHPDSIAATEANTPERAAAVDRFFSARGWVPA